MTAKLLEFPILDSMDPVKALRRLADDIEAGDYGEVTSCAVVVFGDRLDVFGYGQDAAGPTIATLCNAASLRIAKAIEEHGE